MGWGEFFANTGKAFDDFGKNQLGPAVEGAGKAFDEFGKNQLAPVIENAGKALDEFGKNQLGPAINKAGEHVGNYIEENPEQAALIAGSVLAIAAPGIISGPISWIFGWGSKGDRGGSVAAGIQAGTGNVPAGSASATVQSAAIGGYGVGITYWFIQAGRVILGALGLLISRKKNKDVVTSGSSEMVKGGNCEASEEEVFQMP